MRLYYELCESIAKYITEQMCRSLSFPKRNVFIGRIAPMCWLSNAEKHAFVGLFEILWASLPHLFYSTHIAVVLA